MQYCLGQNNKFDVCQNAFVELRIEVVHFCLLLRRVGKAVNIWFSKDESLQDGRLGADWLLTIGGPAARSFVHLASHADHETQQVCSTSRKRCQ